MMKVKKIPMRTCVVCHEKLEKRDKYIDFLHKSVYTKYTIN